MVMEKVMESYGIIWRVQKSTNPVNRMWEMNNNTDAVKPILTANSSQWPPLYNSYFFSG